MKWLRAKLEDAIELILTRGVETAKYFFHQVYQSCWRDYKRELKSIDHWRDYLKSLGMHQLSRNDIALALEKTGPINEKATDLSEIVTTWEDVYADRVLP